MMQRLLPDREGLESGKIIIRVCVIKDGHAADPKADKRQQQRREAMRAPKIACLVSYHAAILP